MEKRCQYCLTPPGLFSSDHRSDCPSEFPNGSREKASWTEGFHAGQSSSSDHYDPAGNPYYKLGFDIARELEHENREQEHGSCGGFLTGVRSEIEPICVFMPGNTRH